MRNRIKELRMVKASSLVPNPLNWREHPKTQRDALTAMLEEIGYADALIARELADGKLQIIDGHLRAETTPDDDVPVLVLDVTEEESKKLLALLDPLVGMAETNPQALEKLLAEVKVDSPELDVLLEQLRHGLDGEETNDKDDEVIPDMELQPYEHYDYVLVLCRNINDWNFLCEKLGIIRVNSSVIPGKKKVGLGRAIDAARLIPLLK